MNKFFTLIGCLLFFNILFGFSDDNLKKEVKLLLDRINQEHVQPRVIDASFAKSVHINFLEYLDPNKMLFTHEDAFLLEAKLDILLNDLMNEEIDYFILVKEMYLSRQRSFHEYSAKFYGNTIAESRKTILNFGTERPTTSNQQLYWEHYLLIDFYQEVIGRLQDVDRSVPQDSINSWSTKARVELTRRIENSTESFDQSEYLASLFLNAIAQSFDPHTNFFSLESKKMFEEDLNSEREIYGISLEFDLNNNTIISDIVPGSPAWLSNEVHVGDIVKSLHFIGERKFDFDGTVQLHAQAMKSFGEVKTKEIELRLQTKENLTKNVHLVKSKVYSDNDIIKNAVLEGERKIGYIVLPDFYSNLTDTSALGCANDLAKCLIKLKKDAVEGIILDLRGNGGGSLKEAVDLVGIFIDYGPVLAIEGRDKDVFVYKDFNRGSIYNGPLIIMIDNESASASEIVASSLQDYNRAVIFGSPSFGKATSQVIYALDPKINDNTIAYVQEDPNLAYANITLGKLFRINRGWNQGIGTQPDVQWTLSLDENSYYYEKDYRDFLVFDSIDKMIKYTPLNPLNIDVLQNFSKNRLETDSMFVAYSEIVDEYGRLVKLERTETLSFDSELTRRNQWLDFIQTIEEFEKELICNFTPVNNQFDQDVIATDEVLKMYNNQFFENLQTDIQLMEGVNVMIDLINNY